MAVIARESAETLVELGWPARVLRQTAIPVQRLGEVLTRTAGVALTRAG